MTIYSNFFFVLSTFILCSCGKGTVNSIKDTQSSDATPTYIRGVLSSTFASGTGIATYEDSGLFSNSYGHNVRYDSSGDIFVGGSVDGAAAVWKYSSNGELDLSFGGGNGYVTHAINASNEVFDMKLDSTGNIILVGSTFVSGSADELAIWKFTSSGTLDTTFGSGNGYVIHGNAAGGDGYDVGYAVALDSSDNIFVTGYSNSLSSSNVMTVWKYTPTGTLDTSFSSDGIVTHSTQNSNGHGITLDSSGNIYVAGRIIAGDTDLAVWKYDSSGNLDTSFGGGDGIASFSNPAGSDAASDISLDSNGNIIITGWLSNGSNSDVFAMRFNPDGTLDTSFASGSGYIVHHNAASGNGTDTAASMILDSEDNIYIVGTSDSPTDDDAGVWKFTSDGELDTTFGSGNGYVTFHDLAEGTGWDQAEGVTLTPSGNIIVTGTSEGPSKWEMALWLLE